MDLYRFDDSFRQEGIRRLAGLDEAGRGPLAGPVVAAAVVLAPGAVVRGLRDSKLVPETERSTIFYRVLEAALDVGVGIAGVEEIERLNVLGATRLAMAQAISELECRPDFLLIDAVSIPDTNIAQSSPVRADSSSAAVAAASVVAKVIRDGLMRSYHRLYPDYGFDRHKGYGTPQHFEALRRLGPCPLHRRSFQGVSTLRLPF